MNWRSSTLLVLALLGGCAPTAQERVNEWTRDGLSLYRMGAYSDARECFRTALTMAPNDPNLMFNLASCQEKLGQPGEAEKLYRRCTELSSTHAEAHHRLIVRLVETNRREEATRLVQDWLTARPGSAIPYVEDAYLLAGTGDIDKARARLQQALGIEPRNPHALVGLGDLYERLGRPDRAMVLYERSLEAKPDQPEVRKKLDAFLTSGVSRPHPD